MRLPRTSCAAAAVALLAGAAGACGSRAAPEAGVRDVVIRSDTQWQGRRAPLTRAERSAYRETSRYADVIAFLDSLRARDAVTPLGPRLWVGSIGKTTEGREIPLVVLSRPLVTTPEQARALRRPVVYVQGNIHGGEVEGKEALQALVRDLAFEDRRNVLDSIVLLAVPVYNADGNERFAPQEQNRSAQNGPASVGQRANAAQLDLNRDYVKAEAPETRASLAVLTRWDPDVFADLHTTDGSYHGYALTYAPSLNPAALFGGVYARDSLLPVLRDRMRSRRKTEVFDYGNFVSQDSIAKGWYTFDARPRFGTNYVGLRGRIAILSEAYSHDPFDRRVAATEAFVRELLSLIAERGDRIRALSRAADSSVVAWGRDSALGPAVPLRSELTRAPLLAEVLVGQLVATGDSARAEAGVPRGFRRGPVRAMRIPVYDRFVPTLSRRLPSGYALAPADSAALRLLREHGVTVRPAPAQPVAVETFVIDSVIVAPRPFQGHREVQLRGTWRVDRRALPPDWSFVPSSQPLGVLAAYLLEPECDDGLATWNVFDARLARGKEFPVLRVR